MQRMLTSVGFIGGGNMATAMVTSLASIPQRPTITVSEPDAEKRANLAAHGATTVSDNALAVAAARVVVLAIKPQMAAEVVPGLAKTWTPDKVLVSILAGMTTAKLATWLPPGARIIRAMPNTPLAIGMGMVGLCRGAAATEDDLVLAEELFAACAKVLRVPDESRMDAITAVSGSGPAYIFRTAEALIAAAESLGFTKPEAELLIGQTLAGSVEYLLVQGVGQAGRLREQVTSPGGTTAAALQALEDGAFGPLWVKALAAAAQRGRELGGAR
ncbi:MAG: pyrroline-5-carboxylate reductase [Planctomycetota bacterium]